MKVKLLTHTGGHVHEAGIPPLKPSPEVIVWGDRFFVRSITSEAEPDGTVTVIYREGLAYFLEA